MRGRLVREVSQHGFEATGIDGAAPLIDKARELGNGTIHAVTYEELGSENVISAERCDAIICNFALLGDARQIAR